MTIDAECLRASVGTPPPSPWRVHELLGQHILADGFDLVLDLRASQGRRLVDARDGTEYLDMFGFFSSAALGMNHPALADDEHFRDDLATAALNKPSNSDVYTVEMAQFVETFARVAGDPALPHLFFVDGGALAVENALKAAFDWKQQHNERHGHPAELGTQVLHLTGAFHGRTGYTMSLTNTDPIKTARYPKFSWPRIDTPYLTAEFDVVAAEQRALAQARTAFLENPHDIACFIAEPIQGEGGDRHLRAQFLQAMQKLCAEFDALFVLDEVQTGLGASGSMWAYQQLGLQPDLVAFGKKTQVCGVMAGRRIDEVPDNVFTVSSRLNSTWGGNLADMVRATRMLEVIERDDLPARAARLGEHLEAGLRTLAATHAAVSDPRGRGLLCAITLPSPAFRDALVTALREHERVLLIGTGARGIRLRPPLTVTTAELDEAIAALDRALTRVVAGIQGQ